MIDLKKINRINLFKNNLHAGELIRTTDGCEILLKKDFLSTNKNLNLTYQIPSREESQKFVGTGLPPYFAGLLPEGLRLKALIKQTKTSVDDLFSLLIAAGQDPVGDIHFELIDSKKIKTTDQIPESFKYIQTALRLGESIDSNSLSGVQDKISADRLSLPVKIKDKKKSYILKLPSQDFTDIIPNEMMCLSLAHLCGLKVNTAKIIQDKDQIEALLVERFDRKWNPLVKTWNRFHQEDACQFLNRYPADKYRISIQEIAEGIIEFSTSPELEVLNLLKQVAFSYLIGNGDLHAKNISLLQPGISSPHQLSPAYDIVCTALYGDHKMALMFDGKNQNLKRKNFIEFGKRYNIPEKATMSMLNKLVEKFQKHHHLFFSFPTAIKKQKFLNQFFDQRLTHLS